MQRKESGLFVQFFEQLSKRNVPYVALHGYGDFPDNSSSDVDYIMCLALVSTFLLGLVACNPEGPPPPWPDHWLDGPISAVESSSAGIAAALLKKGGPSDNNPPDLYWPEREGFDYRVLKYQPFSWH